MKKRASCIALAAVDRRRRDGARARVGLGTPADAAKADKVTLQLKWVTQAQFAGYYAAAAKGYYKQFGLDVTLKPGGPDITPEQVVASGQAQFGLDWLPTLLATRDKGDDLVNIAQVFTRSGMTELTWKSSGINTIKKMEGKKVGVWCCGNENELYAALVKNGIDPKNTSDVTIVNQPFDMNAVPPEPGRRCRGDDVQRARAGARDEEPEDREALQAHRPQRHHDGEGRHGDARGRHLRQRRLDQGREEPGHREASSSRRRSRAGRTAATTTQRASASSLKNGTDARRRATRPGR